MNQLGDDLGARTVSESAQGRSGGGRVVVMKIAKSAQGFGLAPSRRKLREINGSFFTPAPRPPPTTHPLSLSRSCTRMCMYYMVDRIDAARRALTLSNRGAFTKIIPLLLLLLLQAAA